MKFILSFLFLYIFSAQAAVTNGCNCVVFRLDDIQDYWLSNNQQILINTFRNLSIPLTIGIIANEFGEDTALVKTINASIYDTKFEFEVADHGYNHEDFTTFTYAQQLNLLNEALAKIKKYLPVIKNINTFIPPYNAWNNNTATALAQVNITYMSSQLELDSPPYPFSGQKLYRFPEGAQTDLEDTNLVYSIGMPAAYTFAQIKTQIDTYGFAVIMMHPMEFSNHGKGQYADNAALNQTQYNALLELIQMVNSTYTITTIENIPKVAAALAATTSTGTSTTTSDPVATTSTTGDATTTTSTTADPSTTTTTTSADPVGTTTTSGPVGSTTSSSSDPVGTTSSASSTTASNPVGSTTSTTAADPVTTTSPGSSTSSSTTADPVGTTTAAAASTTGVVGTTTSSPSGSSDPPPTSTTSAADPSSTSSATGEPSSTTGAKEPSTTTGVAETTAATKSTDPPATTASTHSEPTKTASDPVSTTGTVSTSNSEPANATSDTTEDALSNSWKLEAFTINIFAFFVTYLLF